VKENELFSQRRKEKEEAEEEEGKKLND